MAPRVRFNQEWWPCLKYIHSSFQQQNETLQCLVFLKFKSTGGYWPAFIGELAFVDSVGTNIENSSLLWARQSVHSDTPGGYLTAEITGACRRWHSSYISLLDHLAFSFFSWLSFSFLYESQHKIKMTQFIFFIHVSGLVPSSAYVKLWWLFGPLKLLFQLAST